MINKLRREMKMEFKPQVKNTQNIKQYFDRSRYNSQGQEDYDYGVSRLEKDMTSKVVFNVKKVNPFSHSTQIENYRSKEQNISRNSYEGPKYYG